MCRLNWLKTYSHESAYRSQEIYLNTVIKFPWTETDLDGVSCI